MQFDWLNNKNNKNLIVFFNGWGSIIPDRMECGNFDVIMFHNYVDLEPINIDFSVYEKKYLITWSLGVYVCNYYYDIFKNFDEITAINGTLKPVDDNFGIPQNAYDMTINNFNELTHKKFMQKIGAKSPQMRTIKDLKEELISIKNLKINKFLDFSKVIISKKDRIFPYKNMKNFWEQKNVKITETEAPHYIFNLYKNWSDLI